MLNAVSGPNTGARDWFSSLPVPPLLSSFCNISSTSLRVDSTPGTNRMNRRQIDTVGGALCEICCFVVLSFYILRLQKGYQIFIRDTKFCYLGIRPGYQNIWLKSTTRRLTSMKRIDEKL
jgi:hypothetical protein